ncbi:SURF1 family protein [Flaviflexus equikiangi]|uniref:SURF1-like protein n=1 Tax=Flaviflexus equikiangi TaxID=2758573 RepID=A0ABS2TE97_9ACTO|nr:SURF1 family protein [Flaviflexus equikiangi]MBM9432980.1 SURF1 family protein [Flaviflexus equikiangi]
MGRRTNVWIREATAPRMIGLLIILLIAAGVCIRLGYWQMERATSRGAERIAAEHEERLTSPALSLADVLPLQTTMTAEEYAQPVYVTGTFAPEQLRVLDRAIDGQDADLVLARLIITEGPEAGGNVPIVRGWVRAGEDLPQVPAGEVTVFGYLADPEDSIGGLTSETALSISPAELVNEWGGPILSGYLVEYGMNEGADTASPPADDGVAHVPPPRPVEEGGFNLQNAAYAVEWVIFAGFALFIWFRVLRARVTRSREDELLEEWSKEFEDASPLGR